MNRKKIRFCTWVTRSGKLRTIRLFAVWSRMRQRCSNPKSDRYRDYGGRGIRVCNIWDRDFISFRRWAIANGYRRGLTIDRIDNDGDYMPKNCRWVTAAQQQLNTRSSRYITFNGVTDNLRGWAKRIGVHESTLVYRLKKWPIERAMTEPKGLRGRG